MVSIVIPTLNEEKYLPRLLESIKGQEFSEYEVIVSDGGSNDQTSVIAASWGAEFIVDDSIKHPSAQRNNGAKAAKGEILLFLDADSVLPSGFLLAASQEFSQKKLSAAGFFVRFNPDRPAYRIYSGVSNLICRFKQYTKHPAAIGAGIMSSRAVHEEINGFDLEVLLAEDYDYCERASQKGKFRMIESVKILYSARRIEKEGFWRSGLKWLHMGVYTMTHRKIRKEVIKYDFGKF